MTTPPITTLLLLLATTVGSVVGKGGQLPKPCPAFNAQTAQQDLAKGKPKLFLLGGIAPLRRAGDAAVEHQFGFVYHDFGCVRPTDDRCLAAYSQVVFAYLNKKYGSRWQTHVRHDVLFLHTRPDWAAD
jgi:hypothetical protein